MSNEKEDGGCKMLPLKHYSIKELCKLYNVNRDTLLEWLRPFKEEIGPRAGNFYTIAQVKIIFKKLDLPDPPDENIENTKMAA